MKYKIPLFALIFSFNYLIGQENNRGHDTLASSIDTTIYTILPTMPEFGNSKEALQEYIVKESKYPASTKRTTTTKNVFVQIIIEKDGKVTFEKIARGHSEKLDEEAKRIISNMPNWSAGRLANGNPARIKYLIPVWFE